MKTIIAKLCADLEKEYKIKILFAIENGSRVWGMDSKDSDYDVRFVYYRPMDEYLKLNTPKDVITAAYDKDLNRVAVQGSLIDISGFDIYKFAKLFLKSNPTTIEWVTSDILYYGAVPKEFKDFAKNKINPMALYHHYRSLSRNNYDKYIRSGAAVTHKKYLYALRGLVNSLYVLENESHCPINFRDALDHLDEHNLIPREVYKTTLDIIKIKSSGKEKDTIDRIPLLDQFIEVYLDAEHDPKALSEKDEILESVILGLVKGERK